jgi:hypothetical protein
MCMLKISRKEEESSPHWSADLTQNKHLTQTLSPQIVINRSDFQDRIFRTMGFFRRESFLTWSSPIIKGKDNKSYYPSVHSADSHQHGSPFLPIKLYMPLVWWSRYTCTSNNVYSDLNTYRLADLRCGVKMGTLVDYTWNLSPWPVKMPPCISSIIPGLHMVLIGCRNMETNQWL